jgi:hypothetical protein
MKRKPTHKIYCSAYGWECSCGKTFGIPYNAHQHADKANKKLEEK